MFLRTSSAPPRPGFQRADVVVGLIVLGHVLLFLPGCFQQVRVTGARTQSTNDLKQIALAFNNFHDANHRLPFNGDKNAVANDPTTGSWAFQILPYLDQQPMFIRPDKTSGVAAYMEPARGRPWVEANGGAWTDYFINNYLNDPTKAATPNNEDAHRTMVQITDGTANTIFVGQGTISTADYDKTSGVVGSSNIFIGGGPGTMRAGPNWEKGGELCVIMQRDTAAAPELAGGGWGGPYPQACLCGLGDGTVRVFPYTMTGSAFGAFLTPNGGENAVLPES